MILNMNNASKHQNIEGIIINNNKKKIITIIQNQKQDHSSHQFYIEIKIKIIIII